MVSNIDSKNIDKEHRGMKRCNNCLMADTKPGWIIEYIDMKSERFELCDKFRSSHLWEKENGACRLRETLWEN